MNVCDECGWGDGQHARNCPVPAMPRLYELLGPGPGKGYQRAVDRQRALRDPRNHPIIACTSADIDAGMFHMEHGYYPGEGPGDDADAKSRER